MRLNFCFLWYFVFLLFEEISGQENENTTRKMTTPINRIRRQYMITCCRNGEPRLDDDIADHALEWTMTDMGPTAYDATCRRYQGHYTLLPSVLADNFDLLNAGVRCKCSEKHLDRNCRHLPDCFNGGHRAFRNNLRCVCPGKYFGELCEKLCLNGERVKVNGIDECRCRKDFAGEACDVVVCYNGGTPVNNRGCKCTKGFRGLHCELTYFTAPSGTRRNGTWQRDLSGTIISLFLVIGLMLAMYFLIRRRTEFAYHRSLMKTLFRFQRRNRQTANSNDSVDSLPPPPYTVGGPDANSSELTTVDDLPPPPAYTEAMTLPTCHQNVSRLNSAGSDYGESAELTRNRQREPDDLRTG